MACPTETARPSGHSPDPGPVPPPHDPQAIRAALSQALQVEFDHEWELVLEEAKQSKSLAEVDQVLNKWRHVAFMEMRDPGSHYRLLAKCEQILRTGKAPAGSISGEEMMAMINRRLGQ